MLTKKKIIKLQIVCPKIRMIVKNKVYNKLFIFKAPYSLLRKATIFLFQQKNVGIGGKEKDE